jgi:hypothetical protein
MKADLSLIHPGLSVLTVELSGMKVGLSVMKGGDS